VFLEGLLDVGELQFGPALERGDHDLVEFVGVCQTEHAHAPPVECTDHGDHFVVGAAGSFIAHTRVKFLLGLVLAPSQHAVFPVEGGFGSVFIGPLAASARVEEVVLVGVLGQVFLDEFHGVVEVFGRVHRDGLPERNGFVEHSTLDGVHHARVVVADGHRSNVHEHVQLQVSVCVRDLVADALLVVDVELHSQRIVRH